MPAPTPQPKIGEMGFWVFLGLLVLGVIVGASAMERAADDVRKSRGVPCPHCNKPISPPSVTCAHCGKAIQWATTKAAA